LGNSSSGRYEHETPTKDIVGEFIRGDITSCQYPILSEKINFDKKVVEE